MVCIFSARPAPIEIANPCLPSPCGANAICKERNNAGACSCLPDYLGNPYEGCRPECIYSSDCPSDRACIRNKCQNPCPGTCGQNAECQVVNHLPSCQCLPGFTGDPFRYCSVLPPKESKHSSQIDLGVATPQNFHSRSHNLPHIVTPRPLCIIAIL